MTPLDTTVQNGIAALEVQSGDLVIPNDWVLGVRFHSVTLGQAVDLIDQFVTKRKARQICLSNAYTIAMCQADEELRAVANRSALNLADGMSIVWGSRWQGSKIPQRVAGPDLTAAVCARAEEKGYRVYLLGSTEKNLENLISVMRRRWPALQIAGSYSPPMCDKIGTKENERILQQLNEAKADILLVGLSAPKQEKWIAAHLHHLPVPVAMGVGAAFDFISGRVPRAPENLQKIGCEWLYRLYREPRRLWRRYLLGNAVFLSLLIADLTRKRLLRTKTVTP